MTITETPQEAYARGIETGKILTKLDHHEEQIKATNTVLAKTVEIAQSLTATVQTLTEARVTDAATRVATAQAVKEAKEAQEAQAHAEIVKVEKFWTPRTRLFGFLVGAVSIAYSLYSMLPHR